MLVKVALSIMLVAMALEPGATEVVSLLRSDFTRSGYDNSTYFKDSYREHMWNIRKKNKSPWVQFDNPYYAEIVYTRIPSEICKCKYGMELYEKGVRYGTNGLMEFKVSDGWKEISDYDRSNFSYLLLINVLNMYKNQIESPDVRPLSDEFVECVAQELTAQLVPESKLEVFSESVADIKFYMNELHLYNYIMQVVKPSEYKFSLSYEKGTPVAKMVNNDTSRWKNMISENIKTDNSDYEELWKKAKKQTKKEYARLARREDEKYHTPKANMMNDRKTYKRTPRGIYNFGNTSYFGASMQFMYTSWRFQCFVYDLAKAQRTHYEHKYNEEPHHIALVLNDIFNTIGVNVAAIGDDEIKEQQRRAYKRMRMIIKAQIDIIPEEWRMKNWQDIDDMNTEEDPANLIRSIYKILEDEANSAGMKARFVEEFYTPVTYKNNDNSREYAIMPEPHKGFGKQGKWYTMSNEGKYCKMDMDNMGRNCEFMVKNTQGLKMTESISMGRYCEDCHVKKHVDAQPVYEAVYRGIYTVRDDKVEVSLKEIELNNAYVVRYYQY